MKSKINMRRALQDARGKYHRYSDIRSYGSGAALGLAVRDQMKEIWAQMCPGDRYPDMAEITGNKWTDTDREDFESVVRINKTYGYYTNDSRNTALRLTGKDKA